MRSAPEASLATSSAASRNFPFKDVSDAVARLLRPAIGFAHPLDVLKDPELDRAEKRAILSSWASDACAVEDRPHLRWPFGLDAPILLADIREALERLDRPPRAQAWRHNCHSRRPIASR